MLKHNTITRIITDIINMPSAIQAGLFLQNEIIPKLSSGFLMFLFLEHFKIVFLTLFTCQNDAWEIIKNNQKKLL